MQNLTFYRVLSYILLPIAGLFGLMAVIALLLSLVNPALLLGTFMLSAVVIYVFTSFSFYNKGVMSAKPCKSKLKDWIKVNAYVAIVFASLSLFQAVGLLSDPTILNEAIKQSTQMQQKMGAMTVAPELMLKVTKGILIFMMVFATLLVIHIIITFRLLKMYKHVFDENK